MRLTHASSYALSAVAFMAAQKENKPVASHHIAKEEGIPDRFLLKVLKPLVPIGVLQSVKGPHGGYRLAKPARNISLLEIVEAVDGPIRAEAPQLQSSGKALDRRLQAVCEEVAALVREQFRKVNVATLADQKKR
jgi:Rrf2 family protein